jgi:hypothetical protein
VKYEIALGELGSTGPHLTWRSPAVATAAALSSLLAPSSSSSSTVAAKAIGITVIVDATTATAAATSSHDNNNKANNNHKNEGAEEKSTTSKHYNAEHNHHKCRKQSNILRCWPEARRMCHPRLASQPANSKSTSKPLSDNKDSFSSVSPKVLSLRFRCKNSSRSSGNVAAAATTVNSMMDKLKMMIIKKKNNRLPTGPTPSLVKIPKSDGQRALNLKAKNSHVSYFKPNNSKSVISLSSSSNNVAAIWWLKVRQHRRSSNGPGLARTASSSITLIVSKRREPQLPGAGAVSSHDNNWGFVAIELPRRLISALCVPLKIGTPPTITTAKNRRLTGRDGITLVNASRRIIDGISCTEATIWTVGALSFQDNNKSNEPLNTSFKSIADQERQVGPVPGRKFNLTLKSLSKSTPSVKSSDKSDTDVVMINDIDNTFRGSAPVIISARAIRNDDEGEEIISQNDVGQWQQRPIVNIPTLTTCEPTMTLTCQSTIVTAQTNDVPAKPRFDVHVDHLKNDSHEDEVSHRFYFMKNRQYCNAEIHNECIIYIIDTTVAIIPLHYTYCSLRAF